VLLGGFIQSAGDVFLGDGIDGVINDDLQDVRVGAKRQKEN